MAEVEFQLNKVSWRDFVGEAAWMLAIMSGPWGFHLAPFSPAGIVYLLGVWCPLTTVMFHYINDGARWRKFQAGLDKGMVEAKKEWEKNRDIQRGIAEIVHEQSKKNL